MDIVDFLLNEIPSENYFYLLYLLIITLFSLFLIFYFSKKSKKKKTPVFNKSKKLSLDELIKIGKNQKSTTKDLLFALIYFFENFQVKQNKDKSLEFFRLILNHKHRNKSLFDFFHGKILPANLEFKDELDKLERKALNK